MLAGTIKQANAHHKNPGVWLDRASRGIVYGRVSNDFVLENKSALEFYINGIRVETLRLDELATSPSTSSEGQDVNLFKIRIAPEFIFEAPASLRVRLADVDEDACPPLSFPTESALRYALDIMDGEVVVDGGTLRGVLRDVNPDALPIRVGVYCRGEQVARHVVTTKILPDEKGGLIPAINFSLALPLTVLDGRTSSVSVRCEGSIREFTGSPIVIRLDAGDGLDARLAYLEQRNERLEREMQHLRTAVVRDVTEQFYRYIVPRVDAVVMTQRAALEGQMTALWNEFSDSSAPLASKRDLPAKAVIRLDGSFIGYRWAEIAADAPTDRWMARSAFVAADISDKSDLIVAVEGRHATSAAALAGLTLTANGVPILLRTTSDTGAWMALGAIPRQALKPHGSLGLLFETDDEGHHPQAPGNALVSLSVGAVTLTPLSGASDVYPATMGNEVFRFGWFDPEAFSETVSFRWMRAEALVVLNGIDTGRPIVIEISGPLATDGALSSLVATLDGAAMIGATEVPTATSGWCLHLRFPPRRTEQSSFGLLSLQARAQHASQQDTRSISIAVADIRINQNDHEQVPDGQADPAAE